MINKTKSNPLAVTDIDIVNDLNDFSNTRRPIRLGFWVLVVGFSGFILWAALAPLDEGVAAQGTVAIETRRKTIQHMNGGVVKAVKVKEGDWVKANDVLLELDESVSRANYESIRQNYMAQRATESRLLAELQLQPQLVFHPDLLKAAADIQVQQHMSTQNHLFAARRASLHAEMSASAENISGLKAQIAGLTQMLQSRQSQAELQNRQTQSVRELASEGYAPRNQVLQLEQGQAELRALTADLQANLNRLGRSVQEVTLRTEQRRQEYLKEVSAQLAEVRREVQSGQEKLHAITGELSRNMLRSPVDGQVVGLTVNGTGGVVTPGQRLMDIVPKGEILLIDAHIPPHIIDKVFVGEAAEVRFSTFSNTPQLVLQGKVSSLSSDVIFEQTPMGTISYYLARIEITAEGLKQLGKRVMQPGMPAEVLVKTGERSMLTYLLHPLTKRVAAAMKEE